MGDVGRRVTQVTDNNYNYGRISMVLTIALILQCCVRLSSVTLCIVAKRCVLEQKLLLTAYRKSYVIEWLRDR